MDLEQIPNVFHPPTCMVAKNVRFEKVRFNMKYKTCEEPCKTMLRYFHNGSWTHIKQGRNVNQEDFLTFSPSTYMVVKNPLLFTIGENWDSHVEVHAKLCSYLPTKTHESI